ncbi:MAG: hypothetical protein JRI57_07150 [Deltaproteobacteria bacterium]|nr:hypothetical protein [Deltaproteobacteria bacterium]MBW1986232.1 hypothetical protein [Deltaproteobacteria bacterium]
MDVLPALAATGIGSVPFLNSQEAVALILQYLPELPFWPQMVKLGFQEDMVPQAARGLPGLRLDAEHRTVNLDGQLDRDATLTQFYELALGGDLTAFALHPEEAVGFFDLLAAVQTRPPESPSFLKGQVVGPVTFAGMVKDQQGKAILFDRELSQAVTQGLALKAAWQAQEIRNLGKQAVIFFDEPYLTGFGSAFMPISRAEVVASLTEAMETCRQHGEVLFGIHCCGNTDWSMLLETPIDILSFDAYGYFDTLILYEQSVENFLARGGYLAWGVVPTSPTAPAETVDQLWKRFQEQVIQLEKTGLDRKTLLSQSLLTPACGLAYLTSEQARQALISLADLSTRARDWQESI